MATLDFKVIPSEAGEFGYLFQLYAMILSGGELMDLTVALHLCQAWGQVHWYLYLSTLKYTLLSTCTCTSVLLFFNHSTCTCT